MCFVWYAATPTSEAEYAVALVPERRWLAVPLYLIAGVFFVATILKRRRPTNHP
jgi:hypothetical protein